MNSFIVKTGAVVELIIRERASEKSTMLELLAKILFYPLPYRILLFRRLLRNMQFVPYSERLKYGALERPNYGFCLYNAALLAKNLGIEKISAVEFGVAGGNGLVNIERHAAEIEKELGTGFEVYGFDMESGLPAPRDHRDLPHNYKLGDYRMDRARLKARLKISKLVLGDVKDTCETFFDDFAPAPVGCIFFDLDYWSSTLDSFKLFDAGSDHFLPRVYCYFDDVYASESAAMCEFIGQRLAIDDFNGASEDRKIGRLFHFVSPPAIPAGWHSQIYVYHDFKHPDYATFVQSGEGQLPLL